MTRPRKTAAERRAEWDEADRRVWELFKPKLAALKSFVETQQLLSQGPRPDAPGRHYYSNLGFFLQSFVVPHGSNSEERRLYIQFIERLDSAGELKDGAARQILESLHSSLDVG